MHLTKAFRKYSRPLLMVIMSLLLVAFLLQDILSGARSVRGGYNEKIGEAFGEPVYSHDLERSRNDVNVANDVGIGISTRTPDDYVDVYLLTEEARRSGVRVGTDRVKAVLEDMGVTDAQLRRIQDVKHLSYERIYESIGRILAVLELARLQANGVGVSFPQLEVEYRDREQSAIAKLSALEAKAFLASVPQPTDEELLAFFEECKDRTTKHEEDKLQFGYKLPDRVQIEYLTVDPAKLLDQIQIKEPDARRFFDEHRSSYYTEVPNFGPQPDEEGQPPRPTRVFMEYEQAREKVRNDFRQLKARELAQSIVNDVQREAHRPWASSPPGADKYRPAPAVPAPSFEELEQKFSVESPVEYHKTELVDRAELAKEPGIGRAFYSEGPLRIAVAELAFRVNGLFTPGEKDPKPVLNVLEPSDVVSLVQTDPTLRRQVPVQSYVFRVIRAVPSAPPESIDEVREKLIEDWKSAKAYEITVANAQKLADRAREVGLSAAVEESTELREILSAADAAGAPETEAAPATGAYMKALGPQEGSVTRTAPFVRGVGPVGRLAKELFALADTPAGGTAPAHRVAWAPLAVQQRCVVGELVEVKPIYATTFEATRSSRAEVALTREESEVRQRWLSSENVRQRAHYVAIQPSR
jgi:hypothetical protein